MRRHRKIIAAGLAVAALSAAPGAARANGRFPASGHLVASSSSSPTLVLETTFGLVVSRDGATWDWVCEDVIGYGGNDSVTAAVLSDERIAVGFAGGLAESHNGGCDWAYADLRASDVKVIDLTRPVLDTTLAIASIAEGGAGPVRTVLLRAASGSPFLPVGSDLDPALALQTIDVAPSDAQRVYLSGTRRQPDGAPVGVLLSSTDGGVHFSASPIGLLDTETAPYIAAVDPSHPDRVYVRTASLAYSDRLLVSDDGGRSFREAFRAKGSLLGFALSADGRTVYLGGPRDGLHRASASELSFARVSDTYVKCLATVGSSLYACAETSLAVSANGGETFETVMRFDTLRGPLSCGKTASVCAPQWGGLRARLASAPVEAGVADASAGPAGEIDASAPAPGPGGACATAPATTRAVGAVGAVSAALGGAAVLSLLRHRARRRRPAPFPRAGNRGRR